MEYTVHIEDNSTRYFGFFVFFWFFWFFFGGFFLFFFPEFAVFIYFLGCILLFFSQIEISIHYFLGFKAISRKSMYCMEMGYLLTCWLCLIPMTAMSIATCWADLLVLQRISWSSINICLTCFWIWMEFLVCNQRKEISYVIVFVLF